MSVSYSQEIREEAKKKGGRSGLSWPLVTIDCGGGLVYQGPISPKAQRRLATFFLDFMKTEVEVGDGTGVATEGAGRGQDK